MMIFKGTLKLLAFFSTGSISDQQRLPLHNQQLTKNSHLSSLWARVQLTGAMQAGAMQRKSSAALRRLQGYQPEVTAISLTGVHTMPCLTGPGLLPEREAY
ncbi:unnamed protein product [Gadus morhua 'NCC']